MADKVTSWFVPQSLLDMVPASQAQAAADQARTTFLMGLLSGDPGQAYTNAQSQGYNVLAHGASLAEAQRKIQNQALLGNAVKGAYEVAPGTGIGTADEAYLPRDANGNIKAGPGWIPPQYQFSMDKFLANPGVPAALATNPAELKNLYDKKQFVNGVLVDAGKLPLGTRIPDLPKGMGVVGKDAAGNPIYGNLPGIVEATASQEGANAAAKAPFTNLPSGVVPLGRDQAGNIIYGPGTGVPGAVGEIKGAEEAAKGKYNLQKVYDPATKSYKWVSVTDIANGGAGANGFVAEPGAGRTTADTEQAKGYGELQNSIADKAATIGNRVLNAKVLMSLSDQFNTGKLAPINSQITQYLNGLGITGDQAKQYASNVELFNTFRQEKVREQSRMFPGSQSDKELAAIMNMGQTLTKPADVNKFYSAVEIAQANRDDKISRAASQYSGDPTKNGLQRHIADQDFMKKSIFADPIFANMTVGGQKIQEVKSMGGRKYMIIHPTKEVIEMQ